MVNSITGLTEHEQKVMEALTLAYNEFLEIKQQHPSELHEFTSCIHRLQDMLAVHIARREYPNGWPTYSIENAKNV